MVTTLSDLYHERECAEACFANLIESAATDAEKRKLRRERADWRRVWNRLLDIKVAESEAEK